MIVIGWNITIGPRICMFDPPRFIIQSYHVFLPKSLLLEYIQSPNIANGFDESDSKRLFAPFFDYLEIVSPTERMERER